MVSILVSSCDAYSSCWKPMCHGLKKYWPGRPWPIYFLTNHLDPPCGIPIKVGKNTDWSTMQRKALETILEDTYHKSSIVLFLLDDFWLNDYVDTDTLNDLAGLIEDGKADRIHLTNFYDEKKTISGPSEIDDRLNGYVKYSRYRTSLQAGLWRISTLLELLKDGETPWEFETKGSIRSQDSSYKFYNVKYHGYVPYIIRPGACEAGEWTELAKEYAYSEGLKIDFTRGPKNDD